MVCSRGSHLAVHSWCKVHTGLARYSLIAIGLVFAPYPGGSRAQAGYVPSNVVYSGVCNQQENGFLQIGRGDARPVLLEAGIPRGSDPEAMERDGF